MSINFFGNNSLDKLISLIKSKFDKAAYISGSTSAPEVTEVRDADTLKGHQASEFIRKGTNPIESPLPIIPKDADTLGGHDADYFAKDSDLESLNIEMNYKENYILCPINFYNGTHGWDTEKATELFNWLISEQLTHGNITCNNGFKYCGQFQLYGNGLYGNIILNAPSRSYHDYYLMKYGDSISALNKNNNYMNITNQFNVENTDIIQNLYAYTENGSVHVSFGIKSGIAIAYSTVITINESYRPRGLVNGCFAVTGASADVSKLYSCQALFDGNIKLWCASLSGDESVTLIYPLKCT